MPPLKKPESRACKTTEKPTKTQPNPIKPNRTQPNPQKPNETKNKIKIKTKIYPHLLPPRGEGASLPVVRTEKRPDASHTRLGSLSCPFCDFILPGGVAHVKRGIGPEDPGGGAGTVFPSLRAGGAADPAEGRTILPGKAGAVRRLRLYGGRSTAGGIPGPCGCCGRL